MKAAYDPDAFVSQASPEQKGHSMQSQIYSNKVPGQQQLQVCFET